MENKKWLPPWVKPGVWGLVIGLIAAPIIAFSADWVTTTGARDIQVASARIDERASICKEAALAHLGTTGEDVAAYKKYDNRKDREALAQQFATARATGDTTVDKKIATACDKMIAAA